MRKTEIACLAYRVIIIEILIERGRIISALPLHLLDSTPLNGTDTPS